MPLPPNRAGAIADLMALAEDPQELVLEMSKLQGFYLLSNLQLALRHPGNDGPTSAEVRAIAMRIQEAICTTPALRALARAGWENRG